MTGEAIEALGPTKIVLADANVLYPRVLQDYFFYAADEGAISLRWTTELMEALLMQS